MGFNDSLTEEGQSVAFCLGREYINLEEEIREARGVQCGLIGVGTSDYYEGEDVNVYRTYWFDKSVDFLALVQDDDPLDLVDSANDSYMIDDNYYGLTQYYFRFPSSTTVVADKFQYKDVTNEEQWSNVRDYRFRVGDTIHLYTMQKTAAGVITWEVDEDRELEVPTGAESVLSSVALVALSACTALLAF